MVGSGKKSPIVCLDIVLVAVAVACSAGSVA